MHTVPYWEFLKPPSDFKSKCFCPNVSKHGDIISMVINHLFCIGNLQSQFFTTHFASFANSLINIVKFGEMLLTFRVCFFHMFDKLFSSFSLISIEMRWIVVNAKRPTNQIFSNMWSSLMVFSYSKTIRNKI